MYDVLSDHVSNQKCLQKFVEAAVRGGLKSVMLYKCGDNIFRRSLRTMHLVVHMKNDKNS